MEGKYSNSFMSYTIVTLEDGLVQDHILQKPIENLIGKR